jgi:hypothetical protein
MRTIKEVRITQAHNRIIQMLIVENFTWTGYAIKVYDADGYIVRTSYRDTLTEANKVYAWEIK